jgi:Lar family restriction alleviation protein
MSDDLKPCPFCTEGKSVSTYFDHEQGDKWGYAACDACGSRGPEVRTGYDRADDALWRAEAITSWNTRTPDTSIEALTVEREFFEEEWVSAVDKLNKAVEALRAVKQHQDSFFFGPDAQKNERASWRGVMRKVKAALSEIEGEKT